VRVEVTMKIDLRADIERYVSEKVRAGLYASSDEAVNELLAVAMEQERLTPEELADLREDLDPALAEADRGEFVEFNAEDVIAEARAAREKRKGA
jgi:antitoxin ParD1/3/4